MASLSIARPVPERKTSGPWVVRVDQEGEIRLADGSPYYVLLASLSSGSPALAEVISAGVRAVAEGETESFSLGSSRARLEVTPCREGGRQCVLISRKYAAVKPSDPQESKLEELGRVAGGVAHDFSNLLTLVSGYTDILLSRMSPQDPSRPELEEIRKAAARGAGVTAQILDFVRKPAGSPGITDLNTLAVEVIGLLKPVVGEHISLAVNLEPGLGKVRADVSQLTRVLMNLILNARDALPQGGEVRVSTSNVNLQKDSWHRLPAGRYVKIDVTDNGAGMDLDTVCSIFRPFYTTKGQGTGLGLSTAQRIVEQAGGAIWTRSEPGRGATFTVCLPRAEGPVEEVKPETPKRKGAPGSETILLAEDEDSVRKLLRNMLVAGGYKVLEAANGQEALGVFERNPDAIDLLLTDVIMPNLNGRELAQRVLGIRPELKVIYMSGYTDDVLAGAGNFDSNASFLRKPLQLASLETKIREVLDR